MSLKYVYIIQSQMHPERHYIGLTNDIDRRLKEHNAGHSSHTRKYRPWKMKTYLAFNNPDKAAEFEKYLKSASGRAFAKKRL